MPETLDWFPFLQKRLARSSEASAGSSGGEGSSPAFRLFLSGLLLLLALRSLDVLLDESFRQGAKSFEPAAARSRGTPSFQRRERRERLARSAGQREPE